VRGEFRICCRAQEVRHCAAGDPELPGDLVGSDAVLREHHDLLKVALSCGAALLCAAFGWCALGGAFQRICWDQALRRFTETCMVAGETAFQDLPGVDEQVKAVGDLLGVWRCQSCAGSIVTASIATDDLHPRMRAQPPSEGDVRPLRQQIDDLPTLQIEQEGSIGWPTPEGKVIHAERFDGGG
jgi:hypothetical protein